MDYPGLEPGKKTEDGTDVSSDDSNVYNYVDKDDIKLPPQSANTGSSSSDHTFSKTTDNIPGLVDNGLYVPGAFRQALWDGCDRQLDNCWACEYQHDCNLPTSLGVCNQTVSGNQHVSTIDWNSDNTSSHDVVRTTNLSEETTTLGLPPVTTILQQVAAKPSEGTSTLPEVTAKPPKLTTTLPEVTAKPVKLTTTLTEVTAKLPKVTTTKPEVTAEPVKLTTTLPEVTAKPPKVTTLPEVTAKLPNLTTLPEMTAKPPKLTATLPEVTAKPPKLTASLPEVTAKPVKGTTTLPEVTAKPPKLTASLPEVTAKPVKGIATLPKVTAKPPNLTTTLPEATAKPPKPTTMLPEVTAKPPNLTPTLPEVTAEPVKLTTMLPEVTAKPPNLTSTLPEVTAEPPKLTTTLPQVTTTLPEVTAKPVKLTTMLPEVTAKPPNLTSTLPDVTAKPVKVTTALPDMTAKPPKLPEVTAKPVKGTTTKPEVTAKPPKLTTTLPQVMTKPPRMTTTLQCLKLTPPANGSIVGSKFSRKVVYFRCDPGYKLVGRSRLYCLSDGTWSGRSPTCIVVECPTLKGLINGHPGLGSMKPNQKVVYFSCHRGYTRVGARVIKCQTDGTWSNSAPTCKAVRCPKLTAPANGTMTGLNGVYSKGLHFRCDQGYTRVGRSSVTCQGDGTWNGKPPTCKDLVSVYISYIRPVMEYGAPVWHSGLSNSLSNKIEKVQRRALRIILGASFTSYSTACAQLGLPTLYARRHELTAKFAKSLEQSDQYRHLLPPLRGEGVMRFRCARGYNLVGVPTITCQADGTWSDSVPTCKAVQCSKPTPPMNSHMDGSCTYYGVMHFRCDHGYNLVGAANIRCQADAVQCPELKPPIHGNMDGSFSYKAAVHFRCARGYNLVGAATITCQADGTWSDSVPTCEAVQCTEPRPPNHGNMDGSCLYNGAPMRFSCDHGYNLVGAPYIRCQADGTWSDSVPTCEAVQCLKPTYLKNGYVVLDKGKRRFGCKRGYNLVGAKTITCQADAAGCKKVEPPVNGQMRKRRNKGNNYLEFRCNQGYRLVGEKYIVCQPDGTWSDSVPTCKAICRGDYQLLAETCIRISLHLSQYSEAEGACRSEGAKLAMPKTKELDLALRNLIRTVGRNYDYWIGLKKENSWRWADGSLLKHHHYKLMIVTKPQLRPTFSMVSIRLARQDLTTHISHYAH
ncbi:hypothetical protein Bbelb_261030 [Branchiostoma belcheri]|nr:hypothetical protein Bbelb_261030 [Branchiostoma belcheri]